MEVKITNSGKDSIWVDSLNFQYPQELSAGSASTFLTTGSFGLSTQAPAPGPIVAAVDTSVFAKIPVEKITIRNSGKNTLWISSPLQKDTIELAAQSSTEIKASSEIGVSTQKIETPLQPPQEKTEATTLQVLTAVEKDIERF